MTLLPLGLLRVNSGILTETGKLRGFVLTSEVSGTAVVAMADHNGVMTVSQHDSIHAASKEIEYLLELEKIYALDPVVVIAAPQGVHVNRVPVEYGDPTQGDNVDIIDHRSTDEQI